MIYQPDYDQFAPNFRRDLVYGREAEELIDLLGGVRLETKRKRRLDSVFYVETDQSPQGRGFKPSGIATTTALYFAYVIDTTGVIIFLPTSLLSAARNYGRPAEERDGNNPTRGFLVSLDEVFMASRKAAA